MTLLLLAPAWLFPAPDPGDGGGLPHADKLVHALLFALLGALAPRAFPWPAWRLALALAAYGGALELAQGAVPGRAPDALDFVADAVGALAAFLPRRGRPAG